MLRRPSPEESYTQLELRPAARHLFVGDLASLPAIAALTEALPASQHATAIVQIEGPSDQLPLPTAETRWLLRGDLPPGAAEPVLDAVQALPDLSGFGQVYLFSESRTVRSVRDLLEARGVARDRIFAKGYWNSQAAPPTRGRS